MRAWLSEVLITASLRVMPAGYVSSIIKHGIELHRLREVAWAAQGLLNSDEYVSSIPREQAIREAATKLRQKLGVWQMHHTAVQASGDHSATRGES